MHDKILIQRLRLFKPIILQIISYLHNMKFERNFWSRCVLQIWKRKSVSRFSYRESGLWIMKGEIEQFCSRKFVF